jgi:Putative restriction endonuclease
MSTVTLPESTTTATQPATQGWIPSPLYRFTLERYEELVESGAFSKQDRFHLINGYLVARMTQNPPHTIADELCGAALQRVVPAGWHVRAAKPVRIPSRISKPEPDRMVVRGTIRALGLHDPDPPDVALIVEVAD